MKPTEPYMFLLGNFKFFSLVLYVYLSVLFLFESVLVTESINLNDKSLS